MNHMIVENTMETLYLVMPAYNEAENIKVVVEEWYSLLERFGGEDSRLVIADNGSTDDTHDILLKLQEKYPHLLILEDTLKQHGPKVIALYDYAIKNGADFIFQTDSDGQTVPEEFREFWEMRNQYDAVIGNRIIRGDGGGRKLIEDVACALLRIFFGVKLQDANAPFRLMKADMVKKYLIRLPYDYSIPNIMLTTYFMYYRENLIFKEITFKPRMSGENSINIANIIKIGWNALYDFSKFRKEMK